MNVFRMLYSSNLRAVIEIINYFNSDNLFVVKGMADLPYALAQS